MLQDISTASILPENSKDDDPHEPPSAEILPFNAKNLNEIVYFPITVDESLSAEAQNIVNRFCGDSVSSLKVEPILRKHQSKIWISVKEAAYGITLHALILGLPSAEFGPVTHISAALHG
jgi:hypothetical protein